MRVSLAYSTAIRKIYSVGLLAIRKQCLVGPDKRPWDMPTSQSNSVLETWTLADKSLPIRLSMSDLAIMRHPNRAEASPWDQSE
jgi:hypothetical protein